MNSRHPNKEISSIKKKVDQNTFTSRNTLYQHNIQKSIQVSKIIDKARSPELSSLPIDHWS